MKPNTTVSRFLYFIMIGLSFCFSEKAQAVYFRNIGVKDGLSQLSVMSIHEDALGRLWFGTLQGLSIYDGREMISLRGGDERFDRHIRNNSILAIVEDSCRDVFFQADDALVGYSLDEDRFFCIRERGIRALASVKGKVYAAVKDSLLVWDRKCGNLRFFMKAVLPRGSVRYFLCDRAGRWWFSSSAGLYLKTGGGWRLVLAEPSVETLYEDRGGSLWAATRSAGLYRISPLGSISRFVHDPRREGTLASNDVRAVTEDSGGRLWIGTRGGLNRYFPKEGKFETWREDYLPGSLKHSSVFSLLADRENNLWVGTYYGGANVCTPGEDLLRYYPADSRRRECLNFPFVSGMAEDSRRNLWICTDGGGLNVMDRRTGFFRSFDMVRLGFQSNNLKSICYDSGSDRLYIGAYQAGLICYDVRSGRFTRCLERLGGNPHSTVSQVSMYQGKVVFRSDYGVYVFDPSTGEVSPLLDARGCASFLIDRKGRLWALHGGDAVCTDLSGGRKQKRYPLRETGIGNHILLCLGESAGGAIYVGTEGGGVLGYDPQSDRFVRHTSQNSGLPDEYCYNIAAYGPEDLILLGGKGLALFNTKTGKVENVVAGDRLPASAFSLDNGLYVASDGKICVGSAEGLIVLSGNSLRTSARSKALYFSSLSVNNMRVSPGDRTGILKRIIGHTGRIELEHDQNNLSLTFADNDFGSSVSPHIYEYRLEGFDAEWIEAGGRQLTYTNLNPGTYTLKVREKNMPVGIPGKEIGLDIVIRQPLWNTPWAWIGYLLSASAILYIIISGRVRQFRLKTSLEYEKREKEQAEEISRFKLEFFTNVSHELRTPLTLIITQAELLLGSKDIAKPLRDKVSKLYGHASGMRNLISELLDFHKIEQGRMRLQVRRQDVIPFLDEVFLSFREQAASREIRYTFEAGASVSAWFDAAQLRKVFSNLLSNALKFVRQGGVVSLSVSEDEDGIIVRVADNGIGIGEQDLPNVFERFYQSSGKNYTFSSGIGLALCKDIVELHHGEIAVKSKPGYGSVFIVRLRKGKEHFAGDPRIDLAEDRETGTDVDAGSWPDGGFLERLQENAPDPADGEEADDSKRRILIVEDNSELLALLADIFSPLYSVSTAADGASGFQKALEEQPDVVVSDIMMPVMDGNEMCRRIKNNLRTCHIPVVLLTARISPEQHIEGLLTGADDYVTKPFNAKILLARVNTLLRNRELLEGAFRRKPETGLDLLAGNEADRKLLKKVEEIVETHIEDPEFDVDRLASLVGMGRSSFFEKLKTLAGVTPASFILDCRLKKAAALLLERPDFQMNDIAACLGFSSGRYFSRCFKNRFNLSPHQYREQNLK